MDRPRHRGQAARQRRRRFGHEPDRVPVNGGGHGPSTRTRSTSAARARASSSTAPPTRRQRRADQVVSVRLDVSAPTTSALINGAAPVAEYVGGGARRVQPHRRRGRLGRGRDRVPRQRGRVDAYENAFDLTARAGYQVDFRSTDLVGNVENFKTVRFTVRAPTLPGPAGAGAPATRRRRSPRSRTWPPACGRCRRSAAGA